MEDKSQISDGYHTFEELYDIRLAYNVALFNIWAKLDNDYLQPVGHYSDDVCKYNVHKSWKHSDGKWCFGNKKEWFIVVAKLPDGQISNHYPAKDWNLFNIPEVEKALFEFDGHTTQDVIDILKTLK